MLGQIELERAALEMTYDGRMTVIGTQKQTDDGETVAASRTLYADTPCALSHPTTPEASRDETGGVIADAAVIFCAPELNIPPGCRIEVEQYGRRSVWDHTGQAAVYPTHQQLTVRKDGRA